MPRPRKKDLRRPLRPTFLREWRKKRGLSLDELAERVGITYTTLSSIERGVRPYHQDLLELLADELETDPGSLLTRDPAKTSPIWTVWAQATPEERALIVDIAEVIVGRSSPK
jgi:transcriptional regulator with XRE-family HTH domain